MKKMAFFLILLGIIGVILVLTIDIIMGKPVNDFSGPKSTPALMMCGLAVLAGIISLFKKRSSKKQ